MIKPPTPTIRLMHTLLRNTYSNTHHTKSPQITPIIHQIQTLETIKTLQLYKSSKPHPINVHHQSSK